MKKPIVLVIMDGVGRGDGGSGDAVKLAQTPTLDMLLEHYPHTWLKAHGTAVGLPTDDDMGNSEVGHNALGCGQVYSQGAKLCIFWAFCLTETSIPISPTFLPC